MKIDEEATQLSSHTIQLRFKVPLEKRKQLQLTFLRLRILPSVSWYYCQCQTILSFIYVKMLIN